MHAHDERARGREAHGQATTALEDLEAVRRIAQRDRSAFEKLFVRYHLRLGRFLTRLTDRRELIDEIINDTMYTVWCKAGEFRGDSRASTWIFGIAYRRALKALHRLDRAEPPGRACSLEHVESELLTDSEPAHREQRDWIERALAGLPLAQRMVMELAYFSGHSCEEIAEIVGCPVSTVKTRMFTARERLRVSLTSLALPVREARVEREERDA
jgi:RNA polymerase sigma-70 factor (ECF subfamily)